MCPSYILPKIHETNTKVHYILYLILIGQSPHSVIKLLLHNFNKGSFYVSILIFNDWYMSILDSHLLYFYIYMVANVMLA